MANNLYMSNRRKYGRPQAMLWSENSGVLESGLYVPSGYEVGYDDEDITDLTLLNQFMILSDHNRSEISFTPTRIEQRQRMINGRMRSFHIADKLTISTSWDMLPSRGFQTKPKFDAEGNISPEVQGNSLEHTADGGAGGVELLNWYENHTGPFWVYLAYDKYTNFNDPLLPDDKYQRLGQYNEIIEMYIADFSYSVVRRGANNFDFWNISVRLEEV